MVRKSWGKRLFREDLTRYHPAAPAQLGPLLHLCPKVCHRCFHLQAQPAATLHSFLQLLVRTIIGNDLEKWDPKGLRRIV